MGILHRAPEGRGSLCVCVWGGEGVRGWGGGVGSLVSGSRDAMDRSS